MFPPKVLSPDAVPRLHLGCGAIDQTGFVNIHGIDRPHLNFVRSLAQHWHLRGVGIDLVYCSHVAPISRNLEPTPYVLARRLVCGIFLLFIAI
jgi:hypothetical protein